MTEPHSPRFSVVERFGGARSKIGRAIQHLAELKAALDAYSQIVRVRYEAVENDPLHCQMVFEPGQPDDIPLIIGDCAHNIRSSLDLMVGAIAAIRQVPPDRLAYPITPENFSRDIPTARYQALGDDVISLMKQIHFSEVGRLAEQLHLLDIVDKHRLIVTAVGGMFQRLDGAALLTQMLGVRVEVFDEDNLLFDVDGSIVPNDPRFLSNLRRTESPMSTLFGHDMPFSRRHAPDVLDELITAVSTVLDQFQSLLLNAGT